MLLKTYGRKFKKSFLEVSNGKRVWSPEVILLRSPQQNRSEVLFDSLCNPASNRLRPSNALTKYRHESNVFDSSTEQSGSDHGEKSGSAPGHLANQVHCKRRKGNHNPRRRKQTTQQSGIALSQADKNAGKRRQGVKRPPTKLSLKSKRQQTRQPPPTSQKKLSVQQCNSSELGNRSSGISSCEILRRHPQKTDSYTSDKTPPATCPPLLVQCGGSRKMSIIEGSAQPRGRTLRDNLEWSSMGDTDFLNLSSLSGMSSTLMSTHNFPSGNSEEVSRVASHLGCGTISPIVLRENNGRSREQHCTADSLASSFLISGNQTNWVTTRKRNRKESRHEGEENKKIPRLCFKTQEISNSARDTSALKNWAPLLASTPVSRSVKVTKARKEWFLGCAVRTPHNAAPFDISGSVLAPDSFTSQRKAQKGAADRTKNGLRRKLSGALRFQVIPRDNCNNLSQKNAETPVLATRNQGCERSPLSSCLSTEVACTAVPPTHCGSTAESSAPLQAKDKMKDLRVMLTDILVEVPHAQNTPLNAFSQKGDMSDLQGKAELCITETNNNQRAKRKQCLKQSPCLASEGTAQQPSFQKELRVKLVDIMKVANMLECPQHEPSPFAQRDVKHTPMLLKDRELKKKFHLKEARVVLTDLRVQGTKINLQDSMRLCSNPLKGEVQHVTCTKVEGCDMQYNSSTTFAKLSFNCSTVTDMCVKAIPQSYNKQFELHFAEHSGGKRPKITSTNTSIPEHSAAELSRMISSTACCTEAKFSQSQVELGATAASLNMSRKQETQYSSMDNYDLGSLSAAAQTQEIVSTVEQTLHFITYGAGTSFKHHSYFENLLESGVAAHLACDRTSDSISDRAAEEFGLLKELKVVLEKCDHHQLMLPPPSVINKNKSQHKDSQRSNCNPKQSITSPQHDLGQDEEPCKNGNWTDCVRRQARLTMARKSVVPSPVLLDASQALLEMCNQNETLTFEQALGREVLRLCKKIGEGTFGEVFRIKLKSKASAIKIVPIEGSFPVNGEEQKTAAEILPEAIICQELSALCQQKRHASCPNFIEVKRLYYIQDCYHRALLKQWDVYNAKRESENERPDFFKADQKFLMFEFADGGISLEDYEVKCATVAKSIFLQVACALAVAETALEFEHRDLHWGNILVAPTKRPSIRCHLPQGDFEVDTGGVLVSLIDYTLSRLRKGGAIIFTDVSKDKALFSGSGDYQFDIYRHMKQHNQNDWKSFRPYTNVLWLHYLSRKLLDKTYCVRSRQQSSTLAELRQWSDAVVLKCPSAKEVFLKCVNKQPL
ncbi:uncharacterized protein LOC144125117 isoform X3 [Amblyomma americanum]